MELLSNQPAGRWIARCGGPRVGAAVWIGLWACGCSQTMRFQQADQGEQADIDTFLHEHLQAQPMVTVAEAYRAMLLLADGQEEYTDFESRRAALEARGIIRRAWDLQREACIDRGSVAYMVCRILQIRGGVNARILGRLGMGDRRYAARELVYLDMMPAGASYRYLTGGELVDLLAEADRYMARHDMYEEEAVDIADVLESDVMPTTQPADESGSGR